MLPKAEQACFLIADISGYTGFIAATEIEHAQDIIADLMNTVVKALRPPFKLAKLEGDAAFVYAPLDKVDGSHLQDAVESAYFKFRRRLRDVRQASACTCKACAAMGGLDLKLVVHQGGMVRQRMAGREELAGRDIIIVHRLLKNTAAEKVGGHAYALYSDDCLRAAGIDPAAHGLTEHHEAIDSIGDIRLWVRDLESAWQEENARTRREVTPADAYVTLTYDLAAPRETVWQHLTVPALRQQWWPADAILEPTGKTRRGTGTVNHCMHGKDAIIEELLDWRPFDYFTLSTLLPVPGAPKIVMTRALEERPDGSCHVEFRVAKPEAKSKDFVDQATARFVKNMEGAFAKLRPLVERPPASAGDTDEPALPPARGRFLSEPVGGRGAG